MGKKSILMVVIIIASMSLPAECTVTYDNEVDFLQAASSLYMESFETLPVDSGVRQHSTLTLSDFTVAEQANSLSVHDVPNLGNIATDGTHYVRDTDGMAMTLTFNNPQSVFGINIIDWGDNGSGTLTFSNNVSDVYQIASGAQPSGTIFFFGIIADIAFTEVSLNQTLPGDSWSVDEVYYDVPEPATLLLLGCGVVMLRRKE